MNLTIKPRSSTFRHAGELPVLADSADPRERAFRYDRVELDLRDCEFVRPAAALWCVVYLSLAKLRGSHCELLVPNQTGVSIYLKSLGLFDILKAREIRVDDRDIYASDDKKTILPITHFEREADASRITNAAVNTMLTNPERPTGLTPIVTELFSELALNATQHSDSQVGAFGCIQFHEFEQGARFSSVVADGGIGVYRSLTKNPELASRVRYDWDALELAVQEHVSGTGIPTRGVGLSGVIDDVQQPGRSLLLHSGQGSLEITENSNGPSKRTRLFPGTLAFLAIPA